MLNVRADTLRCGSSGTGSQRRRVPPTDAMSTTANRCSAPRRPAEQQIGHPRCRRGASDAQPSPRTHPLDRWGWRLCLPARNRCEGNRAAGRVAPITTYRGQHEKSHVARALQAVAKTHVGGWLFINVFPAIDRWLIPRTRGRLKVALGQPMLLLHTRGARSGEPRTTPLLYTPLEDAFIVVASKAGGRSSPSLSITTSAPTPTPSRFEFDGRRVAVPPTCTSLRGLNAVSFWQRVNDNYNAAIETYARRAGGRVIPLVVLDPGLN